jgi:hypothetical protein
VVHQVEVFKVAKRRVTLFVGTFGGSMARQVFDVNWFDAMLLVMSIDEVFHGCSRGEEWRLQHPACWGGPSRGGGTEPRLCAAPSLAAQMKNTCE